MFYTNILLKSIILIIIINKIHEKMAALGEKFCYLGYTLQPFIGHFYLRNAKQISCKWQENTLYV